MLPDWAQDNFFLGFLAGCLFMLIAVGMESFWGRYIQPRLRERKKQRDLKRHKSERADLKARKTFEEIDGRPEPVPPPSSSPRTSASEPPTDATGEIEAQDKPGLETQAMPAVRPSQFSTPPPPLPSTPAQLTKPIWDGPERRSPSSEPYKGEERRGRHSDPDDQRRRRRDDPYERYAP